MPDSGVFAALGYAHESGMPFEFGLVRNHYVGRTFIEPKQSIRHFGVKVKLNPVREIVAGKRIVLIDDSIVRGTTSKKIVRMLKDAGAKEVHMRISSPPTTGPCYYGIDTPQRRELIASAKSIEEIRELHRGRTRSATSPKRGCWPRCARTTIRASCIARRASPADIRSCAKKRKPLPRSCDLRR